MKIVLCICLPLLAVGSCVLAAPASEMESAAQRLLRVLSAGEKKQACFSMKDASRENFRYTPRDRAGILIKHLKPVQREAVMGLLGSALSEKGLLKARQIMALEGVLAELESRPQFRDPEKYFVSVFGQPGDRNAWGWKFEGHHLSLNYTVLEDRVVSVTPSFMGANPAEVREGKHKGLRVLAEEEDLARELLGLLLKGGRKQVVFSDKAPVEILTRELSMAERFESAGVFARDMSTGERAALMRLIDVYVQRHREELAKSDMAKILKAGVDEVSFAWAGSTQPGGAWYYRVQGPSFLMEAANTQNQANHIHVTWRDFDGDFGRDLLGEHYHGHRKGEK